MVRVVHANLTTINQVAAEIPTHEHADPASSAGQLPLAAEPAPAENDRSEIEDQCGAVDESMHHADPAIAAVGVLPVRQAGSRRGDSAGGARLQRVIGRPRRVTRP